MIFFCDGRQQYFYSSEDIQFNVPGKIHLPHTAAAESLFDPVGTDHGVGRQYVPDHAPLGTGRRYG